MPWTPKQDQLFNDLPGFAKRLHEHCANYQSNFATLPEGSQARKQAMIVVLDAWRDVADMAVNFAFEQVSKKDPGLSQAAAWQRIFEQEQQ